MYYDGEYVTQTTADFPESGNPAPQKPGKHSFWKKATVLVLSALAVCFLAGLTASYAWSVPAGASVVLVNLAVFLLCAAAQALRGATARI